MILKAGDLKKSSDTASSVYWRSRHGHLLTMAGIININNARYKDEEGPIDPACSCSTCKRHSRAYISHLFRAKEMLAMRLSVIHNLHFYNTLMEKIRTALDQGKFNDFKNEYVELLDRRI